MTLLIEELPDEDEIVLDDEIIEDMVVDEGDDDLDDGGLDAESANFVHEMVLRIMIFMEAFTGRKLFPYQKEPAYRIIESIIINDGEEISMLQARQSGKSEVLANVIATLMVLLPRFAKVWPKIFGQFAEGFIVGVFAPTEEQADTVWSRIVDKLTSDHAMEFMLDPEIDDKAAKTGGKAKAVRLKNSGSLCRMQTCNPKAKIESKTYHLVLVDEAQDADDYTVKKSIHPMLAFNNGTIVKTGTPNRTKGDFYTCIQNNKRKQVRRRAKQNHFEYDYKFVCKYNPKYKKFIAKERGRLGEDSDEFQMSYCCKWLLEQGMFTTEEALKAMGDPRMHIVPAWRQSQVVVGVDPARTNDSTVVTVVWVDWERPDPYGFCEHRILAWKEITKKDWETQYAEIYSFLCHYSILRIGVDANGMGGPVAERLQVLFPDVEVVMCHSDTKNQSVRWKHLKAIMERRALVYPMHARTKKLRTYKRFVQQMTDLEENHQGQHLLGEAPKANDAHDDYPDSLALACYMTVDDAMQEVESFDSPFVPLRR